MSALFRLKSYFSYWLNAVNEHSLHSPFIYDFYKNVLKQKINYSLYEKEEAVRKRLEKSKHTVEVEDLGAGSQIASNPQRNVAQIASHGVISRKHGAILHRIVEYTSSKKILELGTSLGISTMYLAKAKETQVTTFEGSENLLNIAESVFEGNGLTNIETIHGNIDEKLPQFLTHSQRIDLVFFDANHTKEATLRYFSQCAKKAHDKTCFIFDDISWSKGMREAWEMIIKDYRVTLSIDTFQFGIIFFNPEILKQHFILDV